MCCLSSRSKSISFHCHDMGSFCLTCDCVAPMFMISTHYHYDLWVWLPSWSDILNMKWCLSMTDWRLVYFFLEIHCLQHKLNWSTGKLLNIGINNLNQCFRCMELTVSWTNALDNTVVTCIFWLLENTFISREGVFDLSLIQ